jgi:Trypsin
MTGTSGVGDTDTCQGDSGGPMLSREIGVSIDSKSAHKSTMEAIGAMES